jgi:hypothetical protein
MEFLPHECEFLVDGIVVMRFPDRLVPKDDIRYDYVSKYARVPLAMYPAELEFNAYPNGDIHADQKAYFRDHVATCDNTPDNAASLYVDYVKVWDLPKSVTASKYPRR